MKDTVKRFAQATLMVAGVVFIFLFGLALLPILVALVGTIGGICLAFLPLIIALIVIVIVAHALKK